MSSSENREPPSTLSAAAKSFTPSKQHRQHDSSHSHSHRAPGPSTGAGHSHNHSRRQPHSRGHGHRPPRSSFRPHQPSLSFSKDLYLASHFHFELSCEPESCAALVDPDSLVPWVAVEQVIAATDAVKHCPICLEQPVAAKITRCGHIFCSVCLYHYLSLGSHSWARCPLCFEPVYPQAIKSIRLRLHERIQSGDAVTLTLVTREKHSTVLREVCPLNDNDPTLFTRVTFISDISAIVGRELSELSAQAARVAAAGDSLESQFLLVAQDAIYQRIEQWASTHPSNQHRIRELMTSAQQETRRREEQQRQKEREQRAKTKSAVDFSDEKQFPTLGGSSGSSRSTATSSSSGSNNNSKPIKSLQPIQQQPTSAAAAERPATDTPSAAPSGVFPSASDNYYFYQSRDGQPIFLHSLTFRALLHEHGAIQYMPTQITANIRYLDAAIMEPTQRGRHRFLSHLPLSAPFAFAILDLGSVRPALSDSTIAHFHDDYETEDEARARRAKKDRAFAKKRAQEAKREEPDFAEAEWLLAQQREWAESHADEVEQFPALLSESPTIASGKDATAQVVATHSPRTGGWTAIAARGLAASSTWESLTNSPTTVAAAWSSTGSSAVGPSALQLPSSAALPRSAWSSAVSRSLNGAQASNTVTAAKPSGGRARFVPLQFE